MTLVGHAWAAVGANIERIFHHFGVVRGVEGHHGGSVRPVVNHLAIGIARQQLVVLRETFVELQNQSVIERIAIALDLFNPLKITIRAAGRARGDDEKACRTCPADGAGKSLESKRRRADRKSTRLNSSHGYISYAVFC